MSAAPDPVPPRRLRRSMAELHRWAGLILGWLLFAIAATGTATVFRSEIGDWMRPEIAARADPADAVAAAVRYLSVAAAKAPAWYLTAPDDRSTATIALFRDDRPGAATPFRLLALDPVTGRADGVRETLGGEFLYRLHFELQLPYPWGRLIASACGMLLLVTLISGIITHKRIFADFFTLRVGKGKRSWLDLHNALGVLAMPFHLMITLTGVLTLLTLTLPWGIDARYGSEAAKAFDEISPGFVTRPAAGTPAPPGDVAAMLRDAERRFGAGHGDGGRIGFVSIDNPGDAAALLHVTRNDADQLANGAAIATYAMASGRLVAFHVEDRPARRTFAVLYGLHMGRFAPVVARWLYFLSGLMLSATIATGLVLWTRSRPSGDGFGHRLVARLTVGTVTGVPLAIAAYFWANRLLPLDLANRSGVEVRWFFVALAAALGTGLVLRPRLGWVALLAACGAAWGALPILSALVTGRGLASSVARGDWTFAGFDLVAIALAASALTLAWVTARHRAAEPRRRIRPA